MNAHVLSVGQCVPDDARIARVLLVEAHAHMTRASTRADARRLMAERTYDLVMVNRIFDADGTSGMEFIAEIKKSGDVPVMLVSDMPDMQTSAIALGAVKGFGKSELGSPEIGQKLREALHSPSRAGVAKPG